MSIDFFVELFRGGSELSTELLGLKRISLRNFLGRFKVLQFLGFWVYRKMLLDFLVGLIRVRPELSAELLEFPTKYSANFCNFKKPVSFGVMIFAELYLRRTLELFFNRKIWIFKKWGRIAFFRFFFSVVIRRNSC